MLIAAARVPAQAGVRQKPPRQRTPRCLLQECNGAFPVFSNGSLILFNPLALVEKSMHSVQDFVRSPESVNYKLLAVN